MNLLEILGKIGFDWRMALANLINFLIIFWLLKKFAFGAIKKNLDQRQNKIEEGLENAEKAKTDLLMADEAYKKRIDEAKQNANLIIAKAENAAKETINQASIDAEQRAEKLINDAKTIILKEKEKIKAEIKKETVEVAIAMVEKILSEKIDVDKDKKIIEKITNS